jgi:HAD superfamily hydrolase (TIGR01509 family)
MIQKVVFDLGGVVFNWQPLVVLGQLLPQRIQNEEQARHWAGEIFQTFHPDSDWALFDLGQIEPDALASRIARRTGLTEDEVHTVISGIPPHLTPMVETVDLIHTLHGNGVPLYFLSNMPASYADILLRANPFFDRFIDGIFSAHVNQIKPERPIFQNADARFDAAGPGTLFIDDSRPNIDTAQAHGWQAVHFRDPAQCRAELAAHGLV